jgi:hypothetical protein
MEAAMVQASSMVERGAGKVSGAVELNVEVRWSGG